MRKFSERDPTDLGSILTHLGYADQEQIQGVLAEKETVETLMGKLLIARGILDEVQLDEALELQADLRGKDKFKRAMAAAKIASTSKTRIRELAEAISVKSAVVRQHCLASNGRNGR